MTFLSPLPKAQVNLGSSLSISMSAVDAFGNPITDLVTFPNDLSLSVTQFNVPLTVFGVEGNSPDFFKITSDNKYKANLATSTVQGLQVGPATLCVSSINIGTSNGDIGTARATAVVPPVCTNITLN